ncbi:MerR family transcriptional regulator [Arenibacter algicola]|jgi:DNA-binding transcriptional MerR regulator|uniref:HTH-type transcriptional repressor CarH n=1 Tax=Arenibacter algicola TaxID=616991 RepID=A0A221UZ13_9FLAO|nr:MerR family transcriptional regulator [Arenibacter algicola]ASO06336.1 HTH-type transcriptional repressor CarH [Arenibacter algicola]|tara:strand:- start:3921 stop:4820 length:900 start_codon:yes stop_codon:yes gene_type:complete
MNNVKSNFSIKDLENLSGIKAHTIRIWEKRYNLFQPNRTDTNIRCYDLENLQKLLNVTFLYNNGYKISKISQLGEDNIPKVVKNMVAEQRDNGHVLNSFKMSMMNFDQALFFKTYNALLKEKSFREIFYEDFIPFLNEVGLLWQTDTITPSHEHFICALIKQKILVNTEKLQFSTPTNASKTFVLYLPDNEIHELGLMFLNYEILSKGYQSIFLGQSIPIFSLKDLVPLYDNIVFVSYFTVQPDKESIMAYLNNFHDMLLKDTASELWISGKMLQEINKSNLPKTIVAFSQIDQLVQNL